ncbi:hypothetical protein MSU89_001923 [Cronobacter sakazakii]|uniref:DUF7740 domain-containing protein n=1 Tax=Cronobacter TaxID=413496 RepID=UPI000CFAC6C2|nr:hypothetical protein [Cronobacter sakazakii]EGT4398587.1 hypothetical protein [Cronobacter malonaticus]EGT4415649.1 hypothetical protein [Cronobacter malonaticus]EIZ2209943.1 hypothetical protein [Cronobacter sakazakii]EIZ2214384.1 hypothetical protein [Cronobacter sakazakii]EIZ2218807.1 hypothetical protein [Cronobacter sakazakii]
MSQKHHIQQMQQRIDPAVLKKASDEYSDLLITMCLCMKLAGPTRANVTACARALKTRLTTWHSQKELDAIIKAWDPVGYFLGLRREANEAAASYGEPADTFI